MKIAVRADASPDIGTGHIMRCITLAGVLHANGANPFFVCRDVTEDIEDLLARKEMRILRLPPFGHGARLDWEWDAEHTRRVLLAEGKPDWLIVDHYGLDRRWEERIRPYVRRIMVIDDLANRLHDCDVLLDQNHHPGIATRYDGLVPPNCRKFLGPSHALFREEFYEARKELRDRDGKVRRILVFMGGGDTTNETGKVLEALRCLNRPDIAIDVVIGAANPHREVIARACSRVPDMALSIQVETMARMMAAADLSIGGGGTATWERCYLGLPTIIIVLADNQKEIAEAVAAAGAARNLGWREKVEPRHIVDAVRDVLEQPEVLCEMGKKAMKLVGNPEGKSGNSLCRVLLGENIAPA